MKKTILLSLSLIIVVSFLTGFAITRSSQAVSIKMHVKDLPEHKLVLLGPSDPAFDEKLKIELKGESSEVIDAVKPFSVFFENRGDRPVVAYVVQWCFTTHEGSNQYYRKALMNPQPLMDGENLDPDLERQSGRIAPDSSRFFSLLSVEGSGMVRTEVSAKEAEDLRKGKRPDRTSLLRRFSTQAANYAEITVSIDAAFFDDGTFVGPDTSNFFAQTKAIVDAKRDLLNEIAIGLSNPSMSNDSLFAHVQETAAQTAEDIDSDSTPTDYYNYFKKFYAGDILQTKRLHGQDKALAMAVLSMKKPWAKLRKKQN